MTGELAPLSGQVNRNGRLRVYAAFPARSTLICLLTRLPRCSGYFAQHHVDTLIPTMNPVQFLAHRFPGKTEQEYRQHLGNFQITGMTGLQSIGTLSGGQKSRVAFAVLSLQRPHILLLDEVRIEIPFIRGSVGSCLTLGLAHQSSGFRGSGRVDVGVEHVEWWCYHHLSRRAFYHVGRERGP